MSYKVASIPLFDKQAKRLAKKYPSLKKDIAKLAVLLSQNPITGTTLGKDAYKIRLAITSKGKGKSGGARVITCVKVITTIVYLVSIFNKSEKENITDKELKELIKNL